MRTELVVFTFFALSIFFVDKSNASDCSEKELDKCDATEYDEYVTCVRRRQKRSTCGNSCGGTTNSVCNDNACGNCDCEQDCSYNDCEYGGCEISDCCSSCCVGNIQRCKTNHCCHKTCHAECSTSSCRRSCRKSCFRQLDTKETTNKEVIERYYNETKYVGSGGGSSNFRSNNTNINAHNITTVIHLNNVINNTQLVEIPINMNYSQLNNITIKESSGGAYYPPPVPVGVGGYEKVINNTVIYVGNNNNTSTVDSNCCIVIGPRQCTRTKEYPYTKCFHTRSKQCGQLCTANIMHVERRQICLGQTVPQSNCRDQMVYIPQPQPRCYYRSTWPYVSCGIQQQPSNCEGCYDTSDRARTECSTQCYNDFASGPYYRQGPYYQPSFSHEPPCYGSPCGYENGGYGAQQYGYGQPQPYGQLQYAPQYAGGSNYGAYNGLPPPPEEEITEDGTEYLPAEQYGFNPGLSYNSQQGQEYPVDVMMPPSALIQPYSDPSYVKIEAAIEPPGNGYGGFEQYVQNVPATAQTVPKEAVEEAQ